MFDLSDLLESIRNDTDREYIGEALKALREAEKCLDIGNLKTSRPLDSIRYQIHVLEKELKNLEQC